MRTEHPTAPSGPFIGFAGAAGAAVGQLARQFPEMDLWLVTCVVGDRQLVVASAGRWSERAPTGAEFSWQASLCVRMVTGQAPAIACDLGLESAYQSAAVGPLAKVRAYLGVPLRIGDGELFGTLCALGGSTWSPTAGDAMESVALIGRMLSTVLAGERAARDRSVEAARAYALAERDALTELSNRRGFENAVLAEQGRGRRFGTRSSIVVVTLDDDAGSTGAAHTDPALRGLAEHLIELCQPGDVAARVDRAEFALLAVQADGVAVRALQGRLRSALRSAGLPASVGVATRRPGEALEETWARAKRSARPDERRGSRPVSSLRAVR